ncbi:histidinol-phosphate transaminase [Alienimonas chondri]|uniref:Histidinol-phosphate aminotransferase n=1 Tax=Alienimonas chondri TaxID=2681879 RepID=A0ABX1VHD1_9PLAN|nr:histidinol-phosphate transaminase [Alienimonas chondri]NNJ26176.1 Histidinol-phosphate aminotransferase [Alienimonas chondri]
MVSPRPAVAALAAYAPGEQPQGGGWVKLNTNELPFPPPPAAVEAIRKAAGDRLNRYPDPTGLAFRQTAANRLGLKPDWILPGNGSDEILTLLIRTFCRSADGRSDSPTGTGDLIASPHPTYTLYRTLAEIQNCPFEPVPLKGDWSWDWDRVEDVKQRAKLFFVPVPNSPSGTVWDAETLGRLIPDDGLLVLDGAYADFEDGHLGLELLEGPRGESIVLTRTLSKSYGLAGLRIGYAAARPEVIAAMAKVKDSYNCDALALAGGTAALNDPPWLEKTVEAIRAERQRLIDGLASLGFVVEPSGGNFVFCTHPDRKHKGRFDFLKERRILVRYFAFTNWPDGTPDGLRITVGTKEETDALLAELAKFSG